MAYIDDWKIPTLGEIEQALNDATENVLAFVKNEPSKFPHTGNPNQRTGKRRSARGELFADDSEKTSKSFEPVKSGELTVEIVNTNAETVGYLVEMEREIITDEAERYADKILQEKVGRLFVK